jgi:hypothetical protein
MLCKLFNRDLNIVYKAKIAGSRVAGIEDSIKLSGAFKMIYTFPCGNWFNIGLSNESQVKKSFVLNNQTSLKYGEPNHHIISLFDIHSRLIGFNIRKDEKSLEIGTDIIIQNIFNIRLQDLKWLRNNEVLSRIEPFVGFENIWAPQLGNRSFFTNFHSFLNLGFGLKLNDMMSLQFIFKSFSLTTNAHFDKKSFGGFRINLDVSTSL